MKEGRDIWLQPLLDGASDNSKKVGIPDSYSFLLYLTGKPGMVHTTAVIWLYRLYFKKCFQL
jgi:acetyl-CoA synthetase